MSETLSGIIERVTYHNPENGFCVLKVNVKGHKDLVAMVGTCPLITAGEWLQAEGSWIQDRKFGEQFKATHLKATPPTTLEGIEKYLGSGMIKGIGPTSAKKYVQAFGMDVFKVIEEHPEKLKPIGNLGDKRLKKIVASWAEQKGVRDIMLFLHSHGVSTTRAIRIHRRYGEQAIAKIKQNPYCLAQDIKGIGFVIADQIAGRLGVEKTSILRARAGISHALMEARDDGHCGLPAARLIQACEDLLEVDSTLIQNALCLELQEDTIIRDQIDGIDCIFLSTLYFAEKSIAARLKILFEGTLPWAKEDHPIDPDKAIDWIQKEHDIALSESQKAALTQSLLSKVMIITGGPGVGKTTLLRSILAILRAKDLKVLLAAPTGRAAKRLAETTGMEAKTIHRLLEMDPISGEFQRDAYKPLDCQLVVIDEVSMVDVPLMNALLKAVPNEAAILFVGDADQLPSVGPGHVLGDIIASEAFPVIHLTEVFRQAATSAIIAVAHTLNQGEMPKLHGYGLDSDFYFMETPSPEAVLHTIVDLVTKRLPQKLGYSALNDIQILSPMSRGIVGTKNLNVELQKIMNPPHPASLQRQGWSYSVRDKVMQIKNNYDKEVYNGDIGFIEKIDPEESEVTIRFDDRAVSYDMSELEEIVLSYAMTIHKSQGSEYPVIIIPLVTQHAIMLQKNLVYTGITRGKKLVILVGQKRAMEIAVANNKAQKRWSLLKQRLLPKMNTP